MAVEPTVQTVAPEEPTLYRSWLFAKRASSLAESRPGETSSFGVHIGPTVPALYENGHGDPSSGLSPVPGFFYERALMYIRWSLPSRGTTDPTLPAGGTY